jgi:uncharacterized protein
MTKKFLGRGWYFPIDVSKSENLPVEVEFEECVHQAIWIILSTAKGERVMRPEFGCGIHDLIFAVNNYATIGEAKFEVEEALRTWEPRIELLDIEAIAGGEFGEQLLINIQYRIKATDNRFNLVYPFYLQRGAL